MSAMHSSATRSGARWDEIYELNRDRIVAPDKLQLGMTLKLPKN